MQKQLITMPPSTPLASAIALNNRGVSIFASSQRLEKASQCFRAALRVLRQASPRTNPGARGRTLRNSSSPSKHQLRTIKGGMATHGARVMRAVTVPREAPQQPSEDPSLISRLDYAKHYISARPVRLAALASNQTSAVRSLTASSVISFNLALGHHLIGLTSDPSKAQRYWRSALTFYEIAASLRLRRSAENQEKISMMDMALVNNAAVLCLQLGEVERANVWFYKLAEQVGRLSRDQLRQSNGFMSNLILIGVAQESRTAAAA